MILLIYAAIWLRYNYTTGGLTKPPLKLSIDDKVVNIHYPCNNHKQSQLVNGNPCVLVETRTIA